LAISYLSRVNSAFVRNTDTVEESVSMSNQDLIKTIEAFGEAWNRHDIDAHA
jgi:hypothetical protein